MARSKAQRKNLFQGFIVFVSVIFFLGFTENVARGDKDTDLIEDFSSKGFILRNCAKTNNLNYFLRLSRITGLSYHYIEIEESKGKIFVACTSDIYMLIRFKRNGDITACFCLDKMT